MEVERIHEPRAELDDADSEADQPRPRGVTKSLREEQGASTSALLPSSQRTTEGGYSTAQEVMSDDSDGNVYEDAEHGSSPHSQPKKVSTCSRYGLRATKDTAKEESAPQPAPSAKTGKVRSTNKKPSANPRPLSEAEKEESSRQCDSDVEPRIEYDSDDKAYWKIDEILRERVRKGKKEYEIKWKGVWLEARQTTWEPERHLTPTALKDHQEKIGAIKRKGNGKGANKDQGQGKKRG